MKYDNFKSYIKENYSGYLINQVKKFLSNKNGSLVLDEDIEKLEIESVGCVPIKENNVDIYISMLVDVRNNKVDRLEAKYLALLLNADIKPELTFEYVDMKEYKTAEAFPQETVFQKFSIPQMEEEDMEELAEDLWKYLGIIEPSYDSCKLPYRTLLRGWEMQIEEIELPDNIMGRMYFEKYKMDNVDKEKIINPGTVVLNDKCFFLETMGNDILTIAHEIVHWMAHRSFVAILNLLTGKSVLNCDSKPKKYSENLSDIDKAIWVAEWQANTIGMKFAMPRNLFRQILKNKYQKALNIPSKHSWKADVWEKAIGETARVFGVPKLAAKQRAVELGFTEALGTWIYINKCYHFPFSFKREVLERKQTFLIDKKNLEKLCNENEHLKELLESEKFIYLGYVVCCNDNMYVEKVRDENNNVTGYDLTDYGRNHVDECCLIFGWESSFELMDGNDFYGQCYLNRDVLEDDYLLFYNYGENKNNQTLEEKQDMSMKVRKQMEANNKIMDEIETKNFPELLKYLREEVVNITIEELAARSGLSSTTIKNYQAGKRKNIKPSNLMGLCVGLGLKEELCLILLREGGVVLHKKRKTDWCYLDLIHNHTGETLEDWRELIEAWNSGAKEEEKVENVPDPEKNKK